MLTLCCVAVLFTSGATTLQSLFNSAILRNLQTIYPFSSRVSMIAGLVYINMRLYSVQFNLNSVLICILKFKQCLLSL